MKHCLEGINVDFVGLYLGGLNYSALFEDYFSHVLQVLHRLKKYSFKIKASEIQLFKGELSCLGRLISNEGQSADPKNIAAVPK